ncbi:MAG: protein-L-isoaspartate O-methyltransferase [Novosphingobium sp.]
MTMLDERPATARRAMIDCQLRVSGVNDPAVLTAMDSVAREDYVPAAMRALAYIDRAVSLDDGHSLPAPLVQGRLLVEAALQPGEAVLVVSPCGYLGALVTALGAAATTISPATAARKSGGPYDLILIDGAVEQLPTGLAAILKDGGRVVTGLAERGVTRLAAGRKAAGAVTLVPLADIGMPVLAEFAAPKRWSF